MVGASQLGGLVFGSETLLEFGDFAFAIHIAVTRNLLVPDFPVEAEAVFLDVIKARVALVNALLFCSAQVDEGVGHRHIKLLHHFHLAGLSPFGGEA